MPHAHPSGFPSPSPVHSNVRGGQAPALRAPARPFFSVFSLRSPDRKRPHAALNTPYGKRHAFFPRSAGACPPRVLDPREKRTPTNAVFRSDRGTARDRPSPYGETETALHTVARGPVPRERSREKRLFRSFRSCMSIETRVSPFSRSFRSLIKHARTWQNLLRT